MSQIILVASAADTLTLADGSPHATGVWAEELVVAYEALRRAGHDVLLATPGGTIPTIDPVSLLADVVGSEAKVKDLRASLDAMEPFLSSPTALDTVSLDDTEAVVLPGGHGPMADLATDADLGRLLTNADERGIVIAPFCHGPAGLLSATRADGASLFAGRRVAVFTDEEERSGGLGSNTPWFVADALAQRGIVIDTGAPWTSHVVRDGNLISGQNPQSSAAVAAAVLEAVAARRPSAS